MKTPVLFSLSAILALGLVASCQTVQKPVETCSQPLVAPVPTEWYVLGPFPNPILDAPDEKDVTRKGFNTDYLVELGGEAKAVVAADTAVSFTEKDGALQTATAIKVAATPNHVVDLAASLGNKSNVVGYAFAQINSPCDQQFECYFGSDDWAKVWVNGKLVHEIWQGAGRSLNPHDEHFPVELRKGSNQILVKIDQATGGWLFALELMTADDVEKIKEKERLRAFQNDEIGPLIPYQYCFVPGEFPDIEWKNVDLARKYYGDVPLTVRWFDAQLNEVTSPQTAGRYAAYIEGAKPDGSKVRRAITFYCCPPGFDSWGRPGYKMDDAPFIHLPGINSAVWSEHQDYINGLAGNLFCESFYTKEIGAIFLAGMSELKPLGRKPTQLDEPPLLDQDYQLRLKRKILGIKDNAYPVLALPKQLSGTPAPVLHPGTLKEAGFKSDLIKNVRAVCREWNELGGQPLAVLIARHGVVVMHESFGKSFEGPVTVKTKFPLASLTKCHAGLMLAQFLDQGIINLDDPVGKYLPDFPTTGDKAITLRACMTHMTGFEGHGEFNGMQNAWLDNVLASKLESVQPGTEFLYNGMGFDLGGKVMEMVSGKSIFRLMHENFFIPLGQDNPTMIDLAYGIDCTVMDLARVGQLMLNKGSYGNIQFFSAKTFDDIIFPRPLKEFFPNIKNLGDSEYNLGLCIAKDTRIDDNPDDDIPPARLFSDNSLSHGAASGAILRVDLDKELVIAVSRYAPGQDYVNLSTKLITTVVDAME